MIDYPRRTFTARILRVYGRATDADIITGRNWYSAAFDTAMLIGRGNVERGAGILAAYSPQMTWKQNVELAATAIDTGEFRGHYMANCVKAGRIYSGECPLDVLGGCKVRAFYECIVSAGKTDAVCVDRHGIAIALNVSLDDVQRKRFFKPRPYNIIADAFRAAARSVGMYAAELQAITWVTWRREKGLTD